MSRAKGDKLEEQVSADLGIKKTTNSGAKWDNGDLSNRFLIVECKYKDEPGLRSVGPEIKKLMSQAEKHSKEWLYVQENQAGRFVIMDYNMFVELWNQASVLGMDEDKDEK